MKVSGASLPQDSTGPQRFSRGGAKRQNKAAFWQAVNAVTFKDFRGSGLQCLYRAVCRLASRSPEYVCNGAIKTLSVESSLGITQARANLQKLEALGLVKADGHRTGGSGLTTRYYVVLPPPVIDLKAPVIGGLKAPVTGAKERKGRSTYIYPLRTAGAKDAPSEGQPATPETDKPKPNIKLVPDPSQTAPANRSFNSQTRLYAKLYRKLGTDHWPELTDTMLSQFDELDQGAKKQTLDAFLAQELTKAAKGEVEPAPPSAIGMENLGSVGGGRSVNNVINNLRKAAAKGGNTKHSDEQRQEHQAKCQHQYDKWGGCLMCGEQRLGENA